MIERLRVSAELGRLIEARAEAAGVPMCEVLDGAISAVLDDIEQTRRALAPKRANLAVVREGMVVVAVYDGRFAGVGVDVRPSRPDAHSFHRRRNEYTKFWDGGPMLVAWCDWFRDRCRAAGLELR